MPRGGRERLRLACLAAMLGVAPGLSVVGCGAGTVRASRPARATMPARATTPVGRDPRTASALLRIATTFNDDYDTGVYGPVYDRWDARSQAIISRAEYIRRHTQCPSPRVVAHVESAAPGPHGAWLVDYEISGVQLVDYWFYVRGRWEFDLVLSNPSAVRLYRLAPRQYVVAVGCAR